MQIVFDFVSGKVSFEDFISSYKADPNIGIWLDQLAANTPEPSPVVLKNYKLWVFFTGPTGGHVRKAIESPGFFNQEFFGMGLKSGIYCTVASTILSKYPDAKWTKMYIQDDQFYDKAVARSLGGMEVEVFIDSIMQQFPRTMKAADRVKAGRAAIQEAFHIHDRKFPSWPQEPDWPMGKNSPMEYIGRHKDGELVQLRFRDVDTGEEKIVEQFY